MQNFWKNLVRPFTVLAPMEDVTDTVFRRVIGFCGAPDVYFTEFTSTDGLCSAGRDAVIHRLQYTETEGPLVAQIWGNNPENYFTSAKLLHSLGFDGIDINIGCPVPKIVKNGCCSALIDNPALVKELFLAAKEGGQGIPVSIKTRLGFKRKVTEEWSQFLIELAPAAITMHGRTAKQMSKARADWNEIGTVVQIRNEINPNITIIGNGDIVRREQFKEMHDQYGVDGIMVGRGVFSEPYIFNRSDTCPPWDQRAENEKLQLLLFHMTLHRSVWGDQKPFLALKKFFKIYISAFPGASELRSLLMNTNSLDEAILLIENWQNRQPLYAA